MRPGIVTLRIQPGPAPQASSNAWMDSLTHSHLETTYVDEHMHLPSSLAGGVTFLSIGLLLRKTSFNCSALEIYCCIYTIRSS